MSNFDSNSYTDQVTHVTEFPVRIVFIGSSEVGKTSILHKYFRDDFLGDTTATIGVSVYTRTVDIENIRVVINFYDTAGQEKYRSLGSLYYRDSTCAVVTYDITSKQSFEDTKEWINQYLAVSPSNMIIFAANKSDLADNRQVSLEDAIELASKYNCEVIQTSAKDGTGIEELFGTVIQKIEDLVRNKFYPTNEKPGLTPSDGKSCC